MILLKYTDFIQLNEELGYPKFILFILPWLKNPTKQEIILVDTETKKALPSFQAEEDGPMYKNIMDKYKDSPKIKVKNKDEMNKRIDSEINKIKKDPFELK